MNLEDRLRKALAGRRLAPPAGDCPDPQALAAFLQGDRRASILDHLSRCPSCREDVLIARSLLGATPSRVFPRAWLAAAAVLLFAVAIGTALLVGNHDPEPVAATPPRRPSSDVLPTPTLPQAPEAPRVSPTPSSEMPAPTPGRDATPVPSPRPEPKAEPKPDREPEPRTLPNAPLPPGVPKPSPKPEEKSPPEPTRASLRATLVALAGSFSTQIDGEPAWQNAKLAQARDFSGRIRAKTESAACKARIGATTYYVRGGTELAVSVEEGATVVRLAKGEAFFDVTPGRETFVVETPTTKVTVKGTRFLVLPGEVLVQRGKVEYTSGDRLVFVSAGERSLDAKPAEKVDVGRRLQWLKPLDETLPIKGEAMTLQQGMVLLPDPTAWGGRAVGQKGPPAAASEPSAEVRLKRRQAAPYAVWIRVHWAHGVPPGFFVQVHDAPRWSGKDVTSSPSWQWIRVGVFDLPDEPFRIRVVDPQGGLRFDQVLLTSDLDLVPESK